MGFPGTAPSYCSRVLCVTRMHSLQTVITVRLSIRNWWPRRGHVIYFETHKISDTFTCCHASPHTNDICNLIVFTFSVVRWIVKSKHSKKSKLLQNCFLIIFILTRKSFGYKKKHVSKSVAQSCILNVFKVFCLFLIFLVPDCAWKLLHA